MTSTPTPLTDLQPRGQAPAIVNSSEVSVPSYAHDIPVVRVQPPQATGGASPINVPLDLRRHDKINLPPGEEREAAARELLWFHQHIIDTRMTIEQAEKALAYEWSYIFKILHVEKFEGSWKNVAARIADYRQRLETTVKARVHAFAANDTYLVIGSALDYAFRNSTMTMIIGESGLGKTTCARAWRAANDPGRCVMIEAPSVGGTRALLQRIAGASGGNRSQNLSRMFDKATRAYSRGRILIIDQAHWMLPSAKAKKAPMLDLLMELHDATGVALGLLTTRRLQDAFEDGAYQFEQIIGRIQLPCRLKARIQGRDIAPIVAQYFERPAPALAEDLARLRREGADPAARQPTLKRLEDLANQPGRLRLMISTLKIASQMAAAKGRPLAEADVEDALKLRRQMSGDAFQDGKGSR